MAITDYEAVRQHYRPAHIRWLLIAESPPPPPHIQSSRQFYYTDRVRRDDRLFTNTIRALYDEAAEIPEAELEEHKAVWLRRFQDYGWYMIEAIPTSQKHEVTKKQRQERIADHVPDLL